jgi:hypothetical protein
MNLGFDFDPTSFLQLVRKAEEAVEEMLLLPRSNCDALRLASLDISRSVLDSIFTRTNSLSVWLEGAVNKDK